MALIASVSGIRGTLGGHLGDSLTPNDLLRYVIAFGTWVKQEQEQPVQQQERSAVIVIGRDARPSGSWCSQLASAVLQSMGFDIADIGLTTTPTTAMEILHTDAVGGIMVSASHNPIEWNALKLLDAQGEQLPPRAMESISQLADNPSPKFANSEHQGRYYRQSGAIDRHIQAILALPLVDVDAIRSRHFKVAVDAVNSTGGLAVLPLLEALGVAKVEPLHCEPTGIFSHPPEPLPEHLGELCSCVCSQKLDLGIAVDPDVDRLALVTENGAPFGEEYSLVAVADYVLSHDLGPCVSNLSSSRALHDIATRHAQPHHASAVGEAHVVAKMRAKRAVIGGEGNGGIIYPALHAGRDALVGIALFLSHLAHKSCTVSALRATYPSYYMRKSKVLLPHPSASAHLLQTISKTYEDVPQNTQDGLRIDFPEGWIHIRPSNTEPILRLYTEAKTQKEANRLEKKFMGYLQVDF